MENNLLNLALLQFGISMLLSITAIYVTLKIINKLILKKYNISKDNLAYAILAGGIIF